MATIVGRMPLLEALRNGDAIEKIFMLRTATGDEIQNIKQLAKQKLIPVSQVPVEKLNQLTKSAHQGVVAWAGLVQYLDLQDVISFVTEKGQTPLLLLLDGLTDVRNVGAIARTALCCGAHALILPASNSAALTEEAIKTSAGALRQLMLCRIPSVEQALDVLSMNGIHVKATAMKGSVPVYKSDFTIPSCIVMGAEDTGISTSVKKRADEYVHIPMAKAFDSLNVSVAAGMMLYEAMKQRLVRE